MQAATNDGRFRDILEEFAGEVRSPMVLRTSSIFLRTDSLLPAELNLRQAPFDNSWNSVEEAAPIELARAVKDAGWHFMWIDSDCSRSAWGLNDEAAVTRAIARALRHMRHSFNAAELGVIRITRHLGFRIAKVTVHSRHIQQSALLGLLDGSTVRQLL